jgi:phosphoglycolate phosphatase-like HAD superfamily hydrolase
VLGDPDAIAPVCEASLEYAKISTFMERLILFDIDGTLTRTQNGYLPFNEAILKTFGIAGDIRSVIPDGNTDRSIVEEIFAAAKVEIRIADTHWEQFATNLQLSYAGAVRAGTITVRALPGVTELVKALSADENFQQGVVTGNFAVTARVKLDAAGLSSYLCVGAYGSDSPHRPDLPGIAKERWERLAGKSLRPDHCIIVGDTPRDLEAARKNRMKCVLVGTGRYPVEELEYYKPDASVADLTDTDALTNLLLHI